MSRVINHLMFYAIILSTVLFRIDAVAQPAQLVKDINTSLAAAIPSGSADTEVINSDRLFSVRYFPDSGYELWVTDLNTGTSFLLKDIRPGSASPGIRQIVSVGSKILFNADDGVHGDELWMSDGTTAGTVLLKDIKQGSEPSYPGYYGRFTVFGDKVYFSADDFQHGIELWVTDLTPAGTQLFIDLNPGINSSYPSDITPRQGIFPNARDGLYMSADRGNGTTLVRVSFDGLAAVDFKGSGATNVQNIKLISYGINFVNQTKKLFFMAYDATHGYEIWVSDGDATNLAGTHIVQDLIPGLNGIQYSSGFTQFGSKIIFSRINYDYDTNETEPCVIDGVAETINCDDLNPGADQSSFPNSFINFNGISYFVANNNTTGRELWKSDGTSFTQVSDLYSGPGSSFVSSQNMVVFNGNLYFTADDHVSGVELRKTDGVTISLVKDILPGSGGSSAFILGATSSAVIFVAGDGIRTSIWKSDGTESGTAPLSDLSNNTGQGSNPSGFFSVGSKLFFGATTNVLGAELWTSDGSENGTVLFKDLEDGNNNDYLSIYPEVGGPSGLFTYYGNQTSSVWRTDGTLAGTVKFNKPQRAILRAYGTNDSLATIGGITYFYGETPQAGLELWKTDGTEAGTTLLKDITLGPKQSFLSDFAELNGKLIFGVYSNPPYDVQGIWISDGTEGGTTRISDVSASLDFVNLNGMVLFRARFPGVGSELGISDGTPGGTKLLKDLNPIGESNPSYITKLGSIALFEATLDGLTNSLMQTDGTEGGTGPLVSGAANFSIDVKVPFLAIGSHIYFVANDGIHGNELWITDGTSANTHQVKDINPGIADSSVKTFTDVFGTLYFVANDGAHGLELWRSDGTEAGTVMVTDILPGSGDSSPTNLFPFRGSLYFAATGPGIGNELYKVVIDGCPDDDSKADPGSCGCGVPDTDINSNSIADCLGNEDLLAQLSQMESLVRKIKPAVKKKAKKTLKTNIALEKALLAKFINFTSTQQGFVHISSKKPLSTYVKLINKTVRSSLNVHAIKFTVNKRKALKAIANFRKTFV